MGIFLRCSNHSPPHLKHCRSSGIRSTILHFCMRVKLLFYYRPPSLACLASLVSPAQPLRPSRTSTFLAYIITFFGSRDIRARILHLWGYFTFISPVKWSGFTCYAWFMRACVILRCV
ncbi:hypothetical protein E2C01_036099 [Portunus trituberculatus]|uniref:Uncharacterized protein n=1 Tax=Portunus trituberculatus TaxID=210409 RepID=A0A5B7FAA9_PORTR|nr:hypothetical protein [Portunus trituberculatus]